MDGTALCVLTIMRRGILVEPLDGRAQRAATILLNAIGRPVDATITQLM